MLRAVHPIKPLFGTNQEALVFQRVQKSYPPPPGALKTNARSLIKKLLLHMINEFKPTCLKFVFFLEILDTESAHADEAFELLRCLRGFYYWMYD